MNIRKEVCTEWTNSEENIGEEIIKLYKRDVFMDTEYAIIPYFWS